MEKSHLRCTLRSGWARFGQQKAAISGKGNWMYRGFDKMFSKFAVYRRKYFSKDTFLDYLYTIFNLSGILISVFKKPRLKIVKRKWLESRSFRDWTISFKGMWSLSLNGRCSCGPGGSNRLFSHMHINLSVCSILFFRLSVYQRHSLHIEQLKSSSKWSCFRN